MEGTQYVDNAKASRILTRSWLLSLKGAPAMIGVQNIRAVTPFRCSLQRVGGIEGIRKLCPFQTSLLRGIWGQFMIFFEFREFCECVEFLLKL